MLTDASGNQREGIEVKYNGMVLVEVTAKDHERMLDDEWKNYSSGNRRWCETIRDLMLAGF